MRKLRIIVLAVFASHCASADTLWSIAREAGVDPYLLYAVALRESARVVNGRVVPWPWTIRSDKYGPRMFKTRLEAERHLRQLLDEGVRNIDVGMMQINLLWNGYRVEEPTALLDPACALRIGAQILSEALASMPTDPILAVGHYHSSEDERAYHYGWKTWAIAETLKTVPVSLNTPVEGMPCNNKRKDGTKPLNG